MRPHFGSTNFLLTVMMCTFLIFTPALAGTLSKKEAQALTADINATQNAFMKGDFDTLFEKTHPAAYDAAAGKPGFMQMMEFAVAYMRDAEASYLEFIVGTPTPTYPAGDEEVCFVPRVSLLAVKEKRVKMTGFLIAIRRPGSSAWKYLDSAALSGKPEKIYGLLPQLQKGIPFPPMSSEIM